MKKYIFLTSLILWFAFLTIWVSKKHSQGWYDYFNKLTSKEQKKNLWRFFRWNKTWGGDKSQEVLIINEYLFLLQHSTDLFSDKEVKKEKSKRIKIVKKRLLIPYEDKTIEIYTVKKWNNVIHVEPL